MAEKEQTDCPRGRRGKWTAKERADGPPEKGQKDHHRDGLPERRREKGADGLPEKRADGPPEKGRMDRLREGERANRSPEKERTDRQRRGGQTARERGKRGG